MAKKKRKDSRGKHKEVQDGDGLPPTAVRASDTAKSKGAAKARSLESRFAKLTSTARENLDLIAAYTPLTRPISPSLATLHPDRIDSQEKEGLQSFRLPKKPRWHRELNSKAVQSNEESTFLHWLQATDEMMDSRFSLIKGILNRPVEEIQVKNLPRPAPGQCLLPSMFERNVQVYRQLWRVMERSHLLLVLLDARCPLLHLPKSLVDHLRRHASLKTILVLTKKDIVGGEIADSWKEWLERRFGWPVVVTESYRRQERREGQGKRTRLTPFLSDDSRSAIFAAIKKAHGVLTTPPIKIAQDPEKLAQWRPSCATDIDWEQVEHGPSSSQQDDIVTNNEVEAEADGIQNSGQDSLCIGLIGQPNVGKSSLLNALMGSKVVHASRTPGKTKIFQTHYLGYGHDESLANSSTTSNGGSSSASKSKRRSRVLLCDCPGLVFPSSAGQELQVLGAILPISQVQSFSSIVRFLGSIMPLEDVLDLHFPPDEDATITLPSTANGEDDVEKEWTANLILEALCRRYGYRTAKAGRWDVNRAGNALVRSIAEGRIRWAFRPPAQRLSHPDNDNDGCGRGGDEDVDKEDEESSSRRIYSQLEEGRGIWLPDGLSRDSTSMDFSSHSLEGEGEDYNYDDNSTDEEQQEEKRGKDKLDPSTNKGEKEEEVKVQRTTDRAPKRVTFESGEQNDVDEDETDEEEEEVGGVARGASLFGALTIEGDDEDEDDDEEEEEEEDLEPHDLEGEEQSEVKTTKEELC